MRICTIFTGGTIGSKVNDGGTISTDNEVNYTLIQQYRKNHGRDIIFDTTEPYTILSENLMAEHLRKLILAIGDELAKGIYDGIIVTHGTDTQQYSAAVLGYVFANASVPIVLVSSNYVLDDPRSNGPVNFLAAVDFIREHRGKGVFLSYCNAGDVPTIHRGTRLQSMIPVSDNVYSVLDKWYCKYVDGEYVSNPDYKPSEENNIIFPDYKAVKLEDFSTAILRVFPYPGMAYPEIPESTRAILHESFHSGTICISEDLVNFAGEAQRRNIPIFLTGLNSYEAEYETVEMYRKEGIIPLPNCAGIAQYCKLWLLLSNDLDVMEYMFKSTGEDFI